MSHLAALKSLTRPSLILLTHVLTLGVCIYYFWLDWTQGALLRYYSPEFSNIEPIWVSNGCELAGIVAMLLWIPIDIDRIQRVLGNGVPNEKLDIFLDQNIYSATEITDVFQAVPTLLKIVGVGFLLFAVCLGITSLLLTSRIQYGDRILSDHLIWWLMGCLFFFVRSAMRAKQAIQIRDREIENISSVSGYLDDSLYFCFFFGVSIESSFHEPGDASGYISKFLYFSFLFGMWIKTWLDASADE